MDVSRLALGRPVGLHGHSGAPIRVDLAAEVGDWSDPEEDDHSWSLASELEAGALDNPGSPAAAAVFAFSRYLEDDVHLCLVFVGTVDRTVDRESRSFPGGLEHSSRSVGQIRWAAEHMPLVYSLVAEVLVVEEGSLGHTAHGRSHWPHRDHRSIGHLVDLHRIRSLDILHVAAEGAHSPGRGVDHSCRIVVEEDSQYSVGAPEPAGADRNSPDEERGTGEPDYRPCCQSNGCRSRA
jgi:hypothetical protein